MITIGSPPLKNDTTDVRSVSQCLLQKLNGISPNIHKLFGRLLLAPELVEFSRPRAIAIGCGGFRGLVDMHPHDVLEVVYISDIHWLAIRSVDEIHAACAGYAALFAFWEDEVSIVKTCRGDLYSLLSDRST